MNNEVSEVKLSYKSKVKVSERPKVLNSKASFDILLKSFDPDTIELRETMKMMLLNRANKVLGVMDDVFAGCKYRLYMLRYANRKQIDYSYHCSNSRE